MKKNIFFSVLIALVVSLSSISFYHFAVEKGNIIKIEHVNNTPPSSKIGYAEKVSQGNLVPLDFRATSEKVLDGVVHIKTTNINPVVSLTYPSHQIPSPFRDFFDYDLKNFFSPHFHNRTPKQFREKNRHKTQIGSGSGVIINENGYIVTNHHVIDNADDIEVTLHDNRTYKANIVGSDESTDLALLKIEEVDLPTVPLVNSDQVKTGQWVLAVGNPMGLNSTVTAGIVSAKGRQINILKDEYAIENFIQTDAAINPGNSGGALVNLEGGLVGINTAIASPTGAFAGYGFAIPSNMVSKVVEDILAYGMVQRGLLGIKIQSVEGNLVKEKNLNVSRGVFVLKLQENSAAKQGGLKEGDVILAVNDIKINTAADLQGAIAQYRPGEEVHLEVDRQGSAIEIAVTLNNTQGNTLIINKNERDVLEYLGADFEGITPALAEKLNIEGGVRVKNLKKGALRNYADIEEGFIITYAGSKLVRSVEELSKILKNEEGRVWLMGRYEESPRPFIYSIKV